MTQTKTTGSESPATRAGDDRRAVLLFLAVALVLLGADLAIKQWSFATVAGQPVVAGAGMALTRADVPYHEAMPIVPGLLSLRLTVNRGAVFGLGKGARWLFIAVSVIAVPVLGRIFWTSDRRAWLLHLCLALILSGALGNLYDRVRFGAVRDMFWLFPGWHLPFGWSWPNAGTDMYPWLFNLADAALVCGVALLLIQQLTVNPGRRASSAVQPSPGR